MSTVCGTRAELWGECGARDSPCPHAALSLVTKHLPEGPPERVGLFCMFAWPILYPDLVGLSGITYIYIFFNLYINPIYHYLIETCPKTGLSIFVISNENLD